MLNNLADVLTVTTLKTNVSLTANNNGTGVDMQAFAKEVKFILAVSAPVAGTDPTMDCKIQDSADNSSFADVSGLAFTQVTSSAALEALGANKDELRRYVRLVSTIGGTDNPQYYVNCQVVGVAKNPA